MPGTTDFSPPDRPRGDRTRGSFFGPPVGGLFVLLVIATNASAQVGGIYIDPEGVLREASTLGLGDRERLNASRSEVADEAAPRDVAVASPLRKVSLRRLERTMRETLARRPTLPAEIAFLAGLQRIQYVFFYPEEDDVVLAGPAEGWTQSPGGEIVGTRSRRPVLHLDDLLHALRYAFDDRPESAFLGCSIEPTAEGVKRHAAYMNGLGQMDRSRLPQIFSGMEEAMGPQDVKIYGVPESSRFALKLVAADYRLKRLALAHDPSPVPEVVNYLDLQAKRGVVAGPQRQHRWWFVAQFDALHHSPDRLAWELEGTGVAVQTAPSNPGGAAAKGGTKAGKESKKPAKEPQASPAAQTFAKVCTKQFPKLAERIPVFAELQNLIALSVAVELVRERSDAAREAEAADEKPLYRFDELLDDSKCPVSHVNVPRSVPSLTNSRLVDGKNWLISISGGVEINPRTAAGREFHSEAPRRRLSEARTADRPPNTQWWWD